MMIPESSNSQPEPNNAQAHVSNGRLALCHQEIVDLWKTHEGAPMQLGKLLIEAHEFGYWRPYASSWQEYLEEKVQMSLRKAQELMKVRRKVQQLGVSEEQIESLQWSKLAKLASKMTPENKDELIADAKNMTHSKLASKYPTKKSEVNHDSVLLMTPVLRAAIEDAKQFTLSEDLQQNIEYIANAFISSCPHPHRWN